MLVEKTKLIDCKILTVCRSKCVPKHSHHSFLSSTLHFLSGRKLEFSAGSKIIRTVSEGSQIRRTSLYPVLLGTNRIVLSKGHMLVCYDFLLSVVEETRTADHFPAVAVESSGGSRGGSRGSTEPPLES